MQCLRSVHACTARYIRWGMLSVARAFWSLELQKHACTTRLCNVLMLRSENRPGVCSIGTVWGLGAVIGPGIGGYLSFPADSMPQWFSQESIFATYPFLLPSLCGALINLFGFAMGCMFLTGMSVGRIQCVHPEVPTDILTES